MVKKLIIKRLFESFAELERAIQSAKTTLQANNNTPTELLDRVAIYEEMLMKQKTLATALCGHASLGDWEEVSRHIKLISGYSSMIRDDARDILGASRQEVNTEEREALMC